MGLESGGGAGAGDIPLHPGPEDQERRDRGGQGGPPGLCADARAGVPERRRAAARAFNREDELKRTVRESERKASELERERDEARDAASASRDAYEELTEAYRGLETAYGEEQAAHGRTRRWVVRLGVAAAALVVLLVITILVAWRPFILAGLPNCTNAISKAGAVRFGLNFQDVADRSDSPFFKYEAAPVDKYPSTPDCCTRVGHRRRLRKSRVPKGVTRASPLNPSTASPAAWPGRENHLPALPDGSSGPPLLREAKCPISNRAVPHHPRNPHVPNAPFRSWPCPIALEPALPKKCCLNWPQPPRNSPIPATKPAPCPIPPQVQIPVHVYDITTGAWRLRPYRVVHG